MSEKKWVVDLSEAERAELLALIRKGRASARRLTRAHILLHADEGRTDDEIALALHTNRSTAERARRRFVEAGLEAALEEKPRPGAAPALDERGEAVLLALACSSPPQGRVAWSMRLLAAELVQRQVIGAISDETVRRILKKKKWRPGCGSAGASPRSAPPS
jgi:transposase